MPMLQAPIDVHRFLLFERKLSKMHACASPPPRCDHSPSSCRAWVPSARSPPMQVGRVCRRAKPSRGSHVPSSTSGASTAAAGSQNTIAKIARNTRDANICDILSLPSATLRDEDERAGPWQLRGAPSGVDQRALRRGLLLAAARGVERGVLLAAQRLARELDEVMGRE